MNKVMETVRQAAAVILGVGLVFGGIEMGSSGVPRAQAEPPASYWAQDEMPQYPGMEFPLGSGLAVNGLPVRVSYFEAKARPEEVRDFYVRELEGRGLEVSVKYGVAHGWDVTALSEDGRSEIAIAIMESGKKKVLVFPSIVPLDARPDSVESMTDLLPLSSKAVGVMVVTAKDKAGEAVVTYQEPLETTPKTAGYIRDEMGRRGWSLKSFEQGPESTILVEVQKGGRTLHFTVVPWMGRADGSAITVQFSGTN